jgi:hypothetical protein
VAEEEWHELKHDGSRREGTILASRNAVTRRRRDQQWRDERWRRVERRRSEKHVEAEGVEHGVEVRKRVVAMMWR